MSEADQYFFNFLQDKWLRVVVESAVSRLLFSQGRVESGRGTPEMYECLCLT